MEVALKIFKMPSSLAKMRDDIEYEVITNDFDKQKLFEK